MQLEVGVVEQEGVDDHAAHGVAVQERGDAFLVLLEHRSQVVVRVDNVWSVASHTCRVTIAVVVDDVHYEAV